MGKPVTNVLIVTGTYAFRSNDVGSAVVYIQEKLKKREKRLKK